MANLTGTDKFFLGLRATTVLGTALWLYLFAPAEAFWPVLGLTAIFTGYSTLVAVLTLTISPGRVQRLYVGIILPDLIFITLLVRLTGGAASGFYLAYYVLVAGETYYFGAAAGLAVAGSATVLYILGNPSLLAGSFLGALTLRTGFLYILAVCMAYFHDRQQADARRIERLMSTLHRHSDELEAAKAELEGRALALSTLNTAGVAINSIRDLDELAEMIVELSARAVLCDRMVLMLIDETGTLSPAAARGVPADLPVSAWPQPGRGIVGETASAGTPHLLTGAREKAGHGHLSRLEEEAESIVSLPVRAGGSTPGVLAGFRLAGKPPFTEDDLTFLETICAQAGVAIDNARLYRDIENHYISTISALINAVEARDPYQRGHSERVTAYATLIARQMGLSDADVAEVEHGARLHDIGKIGVSDGILNKPAPLDQYERALVREHPRIGERIVEPVRFMEHTRRLIRHHHERVDGTGYPDGVAGERLSPLARILVVADAFDAMLSDRPYRKALSKEKAVAELRECAGTQFDPEIVGALISALDQNNWGIC